MNRQAIALAADSATTVTYWENGKQERRFFKGANKIFNLSTAHPVGLMTYATANLQGAPWEVVVKAFRAAHGDRNHSRLEGFAKTFFEYIEGNTGLFPQEYQEAQFLAQVRNMSSRTRY